MPLRRHESCCCNQPSLCKNSATFKHRNLEKREDFILRVWMCALNLTAVVAHLCFWTSPRWWCFVMLPHLAAFTGCSPHTRPNTNRGLCVTLKSDGSLKNDLMELKMAAWADTAWWASRLLLMLEVVLTCFCAFRPRWNQNRFETQAVCFILTTFSHM